MHWASLKITKDRPQNAKGDDNDPKYQDAPSPPGKIVVGSINWWW